MQCIGQQQGVVGVRYKSIKTNYYLWGSLFSSNGFKFGMLRCLADGLMLSKWVLISVILG